MKNTILPLALFASSVPLVHAATLIDFESPYTAGALSTLPNAATTNRPFDGQEGWSRSTSTSAGTLITTTTSGNYTGGQGLTGTTGGVTQTYIGGKSIGAMTTMTFDFRYYGVELGVGGWNDDDADSLFDQTEASSCPASFRPASPLSPSACVEPASWAPAAPTTAVSPQAPPVRTATGIA